MNNKGMFYTNVDDYETKEDMMNDFIALRMYDTAKDKKIERLNSIIKINRIGIIDKNDLLKRVEYRYSIGDSSGILKIEQSIYNTVDEIEYFMKSIIPNLYKYDKRPLYIYYYKNFKYSLCPDGTLGKYRMY